MQCLGEKLHGAISFSSTPSFVSGEVVRRNVSPRTVQINECVSDVVTEGMVDGEATLVPDGALVEEDWVSNVLGWACGGDAAKEVAEGEEEWQNKGGKSCGEDGTEEIE